MADKDKIDEDLKEGIKAARKKPVNFALICKGTSVLKAIVQKKILSSDVKAAKTETGGSIVWEGVVTQEGDELVFSVLGEEPAVRLPAFKDLLNEQSGLKTKPRFKVVPALPIVPDDDEGGQTEAIKSQNAGPTAEVPNPPPSNAETEQESPETESSESEVATPKSSIPEAPPMPSSGDLEKIAALRAKMAELAPAIKKAAAAAPTRAGDIAAAVAAFKTAASAVNVPASQATLGNLAKLLKEITASLAPPPPPVVEPNQPPTNNGGESEEQEQQAQEQQQEPPTAPRVPSDAEMRYNQQIGELQPRYLASIQKADSVLAGQMRAIFAYVTEQAEAGSFEKALAAIKRLGPMVDQAEMGTGAASEISSDIVAKRKFLLERWRNIPSEINDRLRPIEAEIERQVPAENAKELVTEMQSYLRDFYGEIRDALDKAIVSGDSEFTQAMKLIDTFRDEVRANELVQHIDTNRLGVKVKVQNILLQALAEVEENLAG